MFELLKTIHVLAAAAWLGGAAIELAMGAAARRAATPQQTAAVAALGERMGAGFYSPAAVMVLLSGIGTVLVAGYGFEELWIILGFVGVVGGSILGARGIGPLEGQIAEVAAAATVDEERLAALWKRLRTLAMVDVALLAAIVAVMVFRPTL